MNTYNPIEGNINNLIPLYIHNNKDKLSSDAIEKINMFSSVRIYGKLGNPKYHLKDVSQLLGINNPIQATNNFDKDEREIAFVIERSSKLKRKYLLTEDGLQRFIYQSNTAMGKLFRKCIKFILDELLTKKMTNIIDLEKYVKNEHVDLYKQSILTLEKNMNKLQEKNRNLLLRAKSAEQAEDNVRQNLIGIQYNLDCVVRDKIEAENKIKTLEKDYEKIENELHSNFNYLQKQNILELQKKHTKPIYIYLENIPYERISNNFIKHKLTRENFIKEKSTKKKITKKKKEKILTILGIEEYNIDNIKDQKFIDFDDNMLFNIYTKKNIKKSIVLVHTIYGSSTKIYKSLYDIMYGINSAYISDIFKDDRNILLCSINDIITEFENIICQ